MILNLEISAKSAKSVFSAGSEKDLWQKMQCEVAVG